MTTKASDGRVRYVWASSRPGHHPDHRAEVALRQSQAARPGGSVVDHNVCLAADLSQPYDCGTCATLISDTGSGHRSRPCGGEWVAVAETLRPPSILQHPLGPIAGACSPGFRLWRQVCRLLSPATSGLLQPWDQDRRVDDDHRPVLDLHMSSIGGELGEATADDPLPWRGGKLDAGDRGARWPTVIEPYASSRAATSRAVPASVTRVLTSRARAAPTIALALPAPTEIPTTCGMRRIRSGVMPSSRGSSG